MYASVFSTATKHFLLVGITKSAVLHLLFGACAGLIAWIAYKAKTSTQKAIETQAHKNKV